jgi:hypothetical protein
MAFKPIERRQVGTEGFAIIRRPEGPPVADCLPTRRWGWVNRLKPRYTLPLEDTGSVALRLRSAGQLPRFLKALRQSLEPLDFFLLDATLLFDGGRGRPTGYHNDLWFSAPLRNQVLQLWIPLVCEGPAEEVARSMLRIDPEPLEDGWACPSGVGEVVQLWTGERRSLPQPASHGILLEDMPGARAGAALEVGEVLVFDNRHCHYTLPSRACRVALAVRLCRGIPVYNGYFAAPRPIDGRALSEANRRSIAQLFQGIDEGGSISADRFLYRMDNLKARQRLPKKLLMWLLLADLNRQLHPCLRSYVQAIAAALRQFGA